MSERYYKLSNASLLDRPQIRGVQARIIRSTTTTSPVRYAPHVWASLSMSSDESCILLVLCGSLYDADKLSRCVSLFKLGLLAVLDVSTGANLTHQRVEQGMTDIAIHRFDRYYPDDRKWVLRNLTTHEFVRSEALAGNSSQNGSHIKDLKFEHIVLSGTYWSLSSDNARFNGRSVNRGIWARHCLEIITLDRHTRSMLSDVTWKNISEDAIKDII